MSEYAHNGKVFSLEELKMFELIHEAIYCYNDAKNRYKNFALKASKLLDKYDFKRKNHKSTKIITTEIKKEKERVAYAKTSMNFFKERAISILDCTLQVYHNSGLVKIAEGALNNNDLTKWHEYAFV